MIKSLKHHKTSSSLVVRCTAFKKDMSPRFPQAPLILLTNKMWLLKPPPPFHLLLLPPYAFVFSFVLLKRINILEGIFPSARLSFYHLPLRETQNASVLRFFFFFFAGRGATLSWSKVGQHIFCEIQPRCTHWKMQPIFSAVCLSAVH